MWFRREYSNKHVWYRQEHLPVCSLTMKHTRVVSTKCTPSFACYLATPLSCVSLQLNTQPNVFAIDTTLVYFIVNEHRTKYSRLWSFMYMGEVTWTIRSEFHNHNKIKYKKGVRLQMGQSAQISTYHKCHLWSQHPSHTRKERRRTDAGSTCHCREQFHRERIYDTEDGGGTKLAHSV